MSEELRAALEPCPFCGSPAELGIVTQGGEANPDYGGHFIQCTNEQCYGCMGLRFACGDDPRPALIDAWNRRAAKRASTDAAPVAWMYRQPNVTYPALPDRTKISERRWDNGKSRHWTETPLYAHPPVAAAAVAGEGFLNELAVWLRSQGLSYITMTLRGDGGYEADCLIAPPGHMELAERIKRALLNDKSSDAYMREDDPADSFTIDGTVDLVAVAAELAKTLSTLTRTDEGGRS